MKLEIVISLGSIFRCFMRKSKTVFLEIIHKKIDFARNSPPFRVKSPRHSSRASTLRNNNQVCRHFQIHSCQNYHILLILQKNKHILMYSRCVFVKTLSTQHQAVLSTTYEASDSHILSMIMTWLYSLITWQASQFFLQNLFFDVFLDIFVAFSNKFYLIHSILLSLYSSNGNIMETKCNPYFTYEPYFQIFVMFQDFSCEILAEKEKTDKFSNSIIHKSSHHEQNREMQQ